MASVIDRQHIDYNVVRLDGVQLHAHASDDEIQAREGYYSQI